MNNYNVLEAGRYTNDISLEELAEQYKRKIMDLVSLLHFKVVVFDFDGTMTEALYSENKLTILDYNKPLVYGNNVRCLNTIKYIITELTDTPIYVLSKSRTEVMKSKENKIVSEFPSICRNNIIQVSEASDKIEVLGGLYEKYKKQVMFVEDTLDTIIDAEQALYPKVRGVHISRLLA